MPQLLQAKTMHFFIPSAIPTHWSINFIEAAASEPFYYESLRTDGETLNVKGLAVWP